MGDPQSYLWVSLGVMVSVIFPVLAGFIKREFPPTGAVGLPPWLKRYGGLLIFSLITSLIALAIFRATHPSDVLEWYTAFLIGFAWESAIEKFLKPA